MEETMLHSKQTMEIVPSFHDEDVTYLSIPRGGPIYVPNLVGPLARVPEFEAAIVTELQSLEAEISSDSYQVLDDDLSVDELKVFKEEELVDMAMKEAFMDEERIQNSSQHSEGHSDAGKSTCLEGSGGRDTEASFKSSNDSPSGNSCNGTMNKNNSRKRKRRKADSRALESSYIAKVEQLAKIKQKQDEDKAAAVLHSFNGSCKNNECAIPSSEKIEMMKSLRFTNTATKVKSSNIREHTTVIHPEVVLCVEVYHNIKTWVKTQEFLVLGQQYLTELRDSIYCSTDQVMQKAGQHDPSGYFLIEDVFCNDMRDPSAIDYSEPIFDWLRNSKDEALRKWECIMTGELQQKQKEVIGDIRISQLPHFKAVDMHKARFCDLRFRLGAGYLYCHQGDCKHTIVIRDVRLIHPEDVHNRAAYPICIFQLRLRLQKCSVCKIYRAEKVTVDDKWASENPCYFCKDCYYLLHYGKDNSLLYSDFSVYDYHHD